ncbi:MAG: aminotransferase class V-fold PLP-dependent enzyme [Lachnospiraceae bacterium]
MEKREDLIYMDHAATTYPKPEEVYIAMDQVNRMLAFNANRGSYQEAMQAHEIIEETRNLLLQLVKGEDGAEVILTPSATIACNQIIGGLSCQSTDVVYVSPYEHNAVIRPLHLQQKRYGFTIRELPLREETLELDLERLPFLFETEHPRAVFLTQMSNVTGYCPPYEAVFAMAKQYGAVTVLDAAQSLGLLPLTFAQANADAIVFAGHKNLLGPFGCGGFFLRRGVTLQPYIAGGTGSDTTNPAMPAEGTLRYEPASPNIVALAGLRAALRYPVCGACKQEKRHARQLAEALEQIPGVTIYPSAEYRTESYVGIVACNLKGLQAADTGMILDEDYHIAVRTGYHCAPLIHKYLRDEPSGGVVRFSTGWNTTEEEIARVVTAVREIV